MIVLHVDVSGEIPDEHQKNAFVQHGGDLAMQYEPQQMNTRAKTYAGQQTRLLILCWQQKQNKKKKEDNQN